MAVGTSLVICAPYPFALLFINKMAVNVLPTVPGGVECLMVTEILVEIYMPDNVFTHDPPLPLPVGQSRIGPVLVDEGAVGLHPFL